MSLRALAFLQQARPLLAPPARFGWHRLAPVRCASTSAQDAPAPSSATAPPEEPAAQSRSAAFLASVPPERLKQLLRDGLALKDIIKLGRKGAAPGLAIQVRQRWYTSEASAAGRRVRMVPLVTACLHLAWAGRRPTSRQAAALTAPPL